MDRTTRPLVIFAAFAGSLVVGLVIMLWALGGLRSVTAPAAIGGPFQLTNQAGQVVTDTSLKGKPTLIFFGFTHCPDVCPTSLFEISEVLKAMGKDADRVKYFRPIGSIPRRSRSRTATTPWTTPR
jgi:protein SCO1/2